MSASTIIVATIAQLSAASGYVTSPTHCAPLFQNPPRTMTTQVTQATVPALDRPYIVAMLFEHGFVEGRPPSPCRAPAAWERFLDRRP